jgi:uncharacterized RDD family membrane protein YckC
MDNPAPVETVQGAVLYAGFWRRFVGWLIDSLILIVLWHWASLPLYSTSQSETLAWLANGFSFSSLFSPQYLMLLALWLVVTFAVTALYYCLLEASPLQATVGKYIVGLQITDLEGVRITYRKAFLRRVYSLLSTIILFIGFIIAGFTAQKQTLHDKLAQTIVIVKHKRSWLALVGIVIATLLLGTFSDHYLGAGFHVSYNSPTTTYDDQNGMQNYIVENGNQVDPMLKQAVISSFMADKTVYTTKDPSVIRQHILDLVPSSSQYYQQYSDMSDSDLLNMAAFFNHLASAATYDELNASQTVWTFNPQMTAVKITFLGPLDGATGTITLDLLYSDGKWNF